MSAPRIFFYVQHLLGIGHLMRAARLARGLADAGFEVELVSGGMPMRGLQLGKARLTQLPPLRSLDEGFAQLADEAGSPITEAWREARKEKLLRAFQVQQPDIVMLEMFPFGRRQVRFELLPLLELARATGPRPLIVSSVRDVVQGRRKPGRAEESAALIEHAFDLVLVHGDRGFIRFEESFPLAARIAAWLRYTGYIGEAPASSQPLSGAPIGGEVLVSSGGSGVGEKLLATALAARPLSQLRRSPWRLLAGGGLSESAFAALAAQAPTGVVVERARPDFSRLLADCHVSVSQAGYNTVMDILTVGACAVLVPFVGQGETEQSLRAARLADRSLAKMIPESELTPARLAAAIDEAAAMRRPRDHGIDCRGVEGSIRILTERLAARGRERGLRG